MVAQNVERSPKAFSPSRGGPPPLEAPAAHERIRDSRPPDTVSCVNTTNEIPRGTSGRGLTALALVVAFAACLSSPFPTLGQIEVHTAGDGFGMVSISRTIPGGCDGGSGTDPCVLQSGCGVGGGDGKYLCGVGYQPGYPVTLSASASPGSSFQGWAVTVTPPNGAPTALPPDSSPTKDVTQGTHAKLDVSVRFSPADAGTE